MLGAVSDMLNIFMWQENAFAFLDLSWDAFETLSTWYCEFCVNSFKNEESQILWVLCTQNIQRADESNESRRMSDWLLDMQENFREEILLSSDTVW